MTVPGGDEAPRKRTRRNPVAEERAAARRTAPLAPPKPTEGLTVRTGQTHVNRWTEDLLRRIEEEQIDPSFVVTHRVGLEDGPQMYRTFRDKADGCVKVVLRP